MSKAYFSGKRAFLRLLIASCLVIVTSLVVALLGVDTEKKVLGTRDFPEIKQLQGKELSFLELSRFFRELAEKKGARYAFDVLRAAPVPLGTDMHLLGHVVGDMLYKQEGFEGIEICTHEFRNACSHSIVIGLLLEKGPDALDSIARACRQAPGGSGAYTMCFHGLGHGALAYAGYELPEAVEFCKKMGTQQYAQREYIECVGGTIMEMIGGVHDRAVWEEKSKLYFSKTDPLYPCNADFMPKEARGMCYVYLTPHLLEFVGADLGKPTPQDFSKAFDICEQIPYSKKNVRDACFFGFGKEFVVLAQSRDIRKIEQMDKRQLGQVWEWCQLTKADDGRLQCALSAMHSLYWGGENKPDAVITFCDLITEEVIRDSCFRGLTGAVFYFVQNGAYRSDFCQKLPGEYQEECRVKL